MQKLVQKASFSFAELNTSQVYWEVNKYQKKQPGEPESSQA